MIHCPCFRRRAGNGDGSLRGPAVLPFDAFSGLVVVDLNGDARLDVAVVTADGNVGAFLGNGDGTFLGTGENRVQHGTNKILAGDFNGDGMADVAAASGSGVVILIGNGNGTFRKPIETPLGNAQELSMGDLDEDGKSDLAVCDFSGQAFTLLGNGDGTFRSIKRVDKLGTVLLADFDADGHVDLAGAGPAGLDVLLGTGTGALGDAVSYPHGGGEFVQDFNGDGLPDTASVSGNLVVVLNLGCHP